MRRGRFLIAAIAAITTFSILSAFVHRPYGWHHGWGWRHHHCYYDDDRRGDDHHRRDRERSYDLRDKDSLDIDDTTNSY